MATPQQENPLFREGRLVLAINAYKQGQFEALQPVITTYDVPRITARHRIAGITLKRGFIALNCCLIPVQEETLKQRILLMD